METPDSNQQAAQKLRMQRFSMSVSLYSIWVVMTAGAYLFDMISTPPAVLWIMGAGVAITVLAFWACFHSNLNLRLAEPSMTFLQCVVGLTWLMVFMFWVPEWRDLLISVYLIVLMFGTFQLSAREFSALAFISFSGYLVMTGIDLTIGSGYHTSGELIFRSLVVGSLLVWCAYFGNHVGALRERLHARNSSLTEVLAEVTHLAERDHLTQAYNRRSIIDTLGTLRETALRYGETFSIVIVDIDFFKEINDRFGHLTGDQVLADFASRMRSELRLLDEMSPVVEARRLGRYGGEEFILMLPRTSLEGARQCAERIRLSTVSHAFGKDLRITISAGAAEYRSAESIDSLLRRADRALYQAKADGRNTVHAMSADQRSVRNNEVVNIADYKPDA